MKNEFLVFSLSVRKKVPMEVIEKVRTNVRGHLTYVLKGITENGKTASALVNKGQWDMYDVPIVQRSIDKKTDRKRQRVKSLRQGRRYKKDLPKAERRAYNEQIQKWIVEHYDIDLDNLKEI